MASASKSIPFVVPPQVVNQQPEASNDDSSARPANSRKPKPREPKFTIEQVFHDGYEDLNLEKAIRSVAFLLKYCSEIGNDPVEGFAALGLGYVLDRIADTTDSAIQRVKNTRKERR